MSKISFPSDALREVYPMPHVGDVGKCLFQTVQLMLHLQKDPEITNLRFVAFEQRFDCGLHFVIEDDTSVYDIRGIIVEKPHVTRVAKEGYWALALDSEKPTNAVKLTNDQFQVLHDMVLFIQNRKSLSMRQIYTYMTLILALWDPDKKDETEKKTAEKDETKEETEEARFRRIFFCIMPRYANANKIPRFK